MRMIAGPNGSGKSTAVLPLLKPEWLGHYQNPDDMLKLIVETGFFDFSPLALRPSFPEIHEFFRSSDFLRKAGLAEMSPQLSFSENRLAFGSLPTEPTFAYFVSVLADFVRRQWIENGISFTFETVMSSYDKVELLAHARKHGYRTYLYFVATKDVELNVRRVEQRVRFQGHSVPEEKIRERYARSLDYLRDAIRHSRRAYIFDNSEEAAKPIAEFCEQADPSAGHQFTPLVDSAPAWFHQSVLAKVS